MTCPYTSTIGVYLLGALQPDERSTFESHLAGCHVCRTELVRLAPLPGLLHQISREDFDDLHEHSLPPAPTGEAPGPAAGSPVAPEPEPPERPEPIRPGTPDARPPGKRYRLVAVAAAVVVVVVTIAGILGYAVSREPPVTAPPAGVTWSATNSVSGISAHARVIERDWGTEIQVRMSNVPAYRDCKLVVRARNGYRGVAGYFETAGWWQSGHDPAEEIPASTSIELADIDTLEFVDEDKQVLVSIHAPKS
jgi:hypothetical protein